MAGHNIFALKKWAFSDQGFLFITTTTGYTFSYIYLLIMGRMLGPESFGALGAMFAIFSIATLFGQALRTAIATEISEIKAMQGEGPAVSAFLNMGTKLSIISILPCVLIIIAVKGATVFFKIDSVWPVVIAGVSVFTALFLDIILGLLQGLQMFKLLGIVGYTISQGFKVVSGVALVSLTWNLTGAVGALAVSTALASIVGLVMIKGKVTNALCSPIRLNVKIRPMMQRTLLLALFLSMPASLDVIMVAHYFAGADAGMYNAVATIGKIVFFLPMPISMILLPRETEQHARGKGNRSVLWRSLGLTAFLSGAVAAITTMFPETVVKIFWGEAYLNAAPLIGLYCTAMFCFSINVVFVHYYLAIRKLWMIILSNLITLAEVFGIVVWHQSLSQIIWVLLLGNLVIILFSLIYLVLKRERVPDSGSIS